jgi:hypothetical protein
MFRSFTSHQKRSYRRSVDHNPGSSENAHASAKLSSIPHQFQAAFLTHARDRMVIVKPSYSSPHPTRQIPSRTDKKQDTDGGLWYVASAKNRTLSTFVPRLFALH